jgi:hypothetical protein
MPRRPYPSNLAAALTIINPLARPFVDYFHYRPIERRHQRGVTSLSDAVQNSYCLDIPYKTLLYFSDPLVILGAYHDIEHLVFNHYVSIAFTRSKATGGKSVMTPRLLPSYGLDTFAALGYLQGESQDLLAAEADPNSALKFVEDSLAQGWYVSSNVNKYYINGTDWYKRFDHRHTILIVGYTASHFTIIGYTGSCFDKLEVPRALLGRAIVSRGTFGRPQLPHYMFGIPRLRRFRVGARKPSPNIKQLQLQLSDYLSSTMPSPTSLNPAQGIRESDCTSAFVRSCGFGFAAWDLYEDYLRHVIRAPRDLDARVIRTIWEHKKMMGIRLAHLRESGFLSHAALESEYKPVVDWACAIHTAQFTLKPGPDLLRTLKRLLATLADMRELEKMVITTAIRAIAESQIAQGHLPSTTAK